MKHHNPKPKPRQPHLITQVTTQNKTEDKESVSECRYGIFCAHLRAQGRCVHLHRRSHFHFLNLVAPSNCLDDPSSEPENLTKREKKERKTIEKTIEQQIDVAQLDRREQLMRNKENVEAKKELMEGLQTNEKKLLELSESSSAAAFFQQLNATLKEGHEVSELKRKALVHLKKKNEVLYSEIIDKECRIASRLIKAHRKSKGMTVAQLYADINHGTPVPIAEYFSRYFDPEAGIPCLKSESLLGLSNRIVISSILDNVLHLEPESYHRQVYFHGGSKKTTSEQLKGNVQLFNKVVPFRMQKKMPFVKFLYIDCQQDLTFLKTGQNLAREHVNTFHAKSKAAPECPFGQLEQNVQKFSVWVGKILQKLKQSGSEFKVVMIVDNVKSLFPTASLQQFELQKFKERKALFLALRQVFDPVIIALVPSESEQLSAGLLQLLQVNRELTQRLE